MEHDDRRPVSGSSCGTTSADVVRLRTLDRWLAYPWHTGIQVNELEDLTAIRAATRNSTYDLAVISAHRGEILVRGGKYFPDWTPVQFVGCSLGGGLLKRYGVHVGFSMEFYSKGRLIVTSPVQAVALAPEARSDVETRRSDIRPSAPPPAG